MPPTVTSRSYRILVIEDSNLMRISMCARLKECGLSTIESSNATDGIRLATEEFPDCIVLDLGLPDRGGMGTLLELKNACPLVPVIVVTATQDISNQARILAKGAVDYLRKPVEPGILEEAIFTQIKSARRLQRIRNRAELSLRSETTPDLDGKKSVSPPGLVWQRAVSCNLPVSVIRVDVINKTRLEFVPESALDAMIKSVEVLLKCELRASDLVAREKRNGYLFVLQDVTFQNAHLIIERLKDASKKAVSISNGRRNPELHLVFGAAERQHDGIISLAKLIDIADQRLSEYLEQLSNDACSNIQSYAELGEAI